MSFVKKMRKFLRSPQIFFRDSDNYFSKKVLKYLNRNNKKIIDNKTKIITNDTSKNFDIWFEYKKIKYDKKVDTFIYPTSIFLLDKIRLENLEKYGLECAIINLWKYFNDSEDIDDIEYICKKDIDKATAVAHSIVNESMQRDIKNIVLPYDGTILTRCIIMACRKVEICTICYFVSDYNVFNLYNNFSFPISDIILLEDKFCRNFLSRFGQLKNIFVIKSEKYLPENDTFSLKSFLGIDNSEDIILFFSPILQFSRSNIDIENDMMKNIKLCTKNIKSNDLLIIFRKRKKRGFFSKKIEKEISNIPKKIVIEYHNYYNFNDICESAKEIFIPFVLNNLVQEKKYIYDEVKDLKCDLIFPKEFNKNELHKYKNSMSENIIHKLHGNMNYIDIIAVPDPIDSVVTLGRQKYLLELMNARKRVYGADNKEIIAGAEYFIQWGAQPNEAKLRQEKNRTALLRQHIFLEDGFIRSFGLWTDPNEPTLSIIFDTKSVYYDALHETLLEDILNSEFKLTNDQFLYSQKMINKIINNKISKYNYMPIVALNFPKNDKKKILLVDQKSGDMSIKYGMANNDTFDIMLKKAVSLDNAEIIIKQHPCAITEGKKYAHYTNEKISLINKARNIHLISFDINPYCLINAVDEVWTVSSGMGFEALLCGKTVRCFGVPFYSNWGITEDEKKLLRRKRKRTVEEIFYVFYILLSKYINPNSGKSCNLEELIDYFSLKA